MSELSPVFREAARTERTKLLSQRATLQRQCDELSSKIEKLDELIEPLDDLIGEQVVEEASSTPLYGKPDWSKSTRRAAILASLAAGKPLKPAAIRDAFQAHGRSEQITNGISAMLDTMRKRGEVVSGPKGWTLTDKGKEIIDKAVGGSQEKA
ncbi:MAG TPA: hypothetical protein VGB83_00850 [Actinomycetota bacterium]